MSPDIWGKYAWLFIHFVTMGYPENPTDEDKQRYYEYFQTLQYVLPCKKCRNNMSKHLNTLPLTEQSLVDRNSLVRWGINFHNVVNRSIGKPIISYNEAMHQLDELTHPSSKRDSFSKYLLYLIIIILIIILCYFIYLCVRKKKLNI